LVFRAVFPIEIGRFVALPHVVFGHGESPESVANIEQIAGTVFKSPTASERKINLAIVLAPW
jgi:hypothetical protein